jgi:acyl carrier protein
MEFENALEIIITEICRMARAGFAPSELAEKNLSAETALAELNLDSLGRLSLLTAVEDRADAMLSEGDLPNLKTLGDLARVVTENAAVAV